MARPKTASATAAKEMYDDLRDLVAAIDRRVPHLERLTEATIAQDAASLRERAVELMRAIEATVPLKG